jgi:benzoylformate decarboxylase
VKTVHDLTYELLRSRGLTTVFGNPGSNELPFLSNFPGDFRYILGLHEGVVVGMADGYAQATGRPALVNLHSAAGVGNAMGALVNAAVAHSPLVITAGQQARAMMTLEAQLTNVDAPQLPRPLVKWSFEPPRPQDVPAALMRAIHLASLPPCGPVFVSVPFDDWAAPADEDLGGLLAERSVTSSAPPAPGLVAELARRLGQARNPVMVVGAEVDVPGAFEAAVQLVERCRMPVWIAPSPSRCPFPTTHRCFRGVLPFGIRPLAEKLAGHDLIVVFGAPVFRYHQFAPGPYLPEGAQLVAVTSDAAEAARAPMGEAIVADVTLTLEALAAVTPSNLASNRPLAEPRPRPKPAADSAALLSAAAVFDILDQVKPADAVIVNESTGNTGTFWKRVNFDRPRSFYFPAAGSLGFGVAATAGVQLAEPRRPVIGVIGDGSANYAITGLWTAARYHLPATFLILRNEEYGALKWFAGVLGVGNLPGLELGGIDYRALAGGYGMHAVRASGGEELAAALKNAIASDAPELIEVAIERQAFD